MHTVVITLTLRLSHLYTHFYTLYSSISHTMLTHLPHSHTYALSLLHTLRLSHPYMHFYTLSLQLHHMVTCSHTCSHTPTQSPHSHTCALSLLHTCSDTFMTHTVTHTPSDSHSYMHFYIFSPALSHTHTVAHMHFYTLSPTLSHVYTLSHTHIHSHTQAHALPGHLKATLSGEDSRHPHLLDDLPPSLSHQSPAHSRSHVCTLRSPNTHSLSLTFSHLHTHAHTRGHTHWLLRAQPQHIVQWPHLPSGPDSRPHATAATSRGGRPRRSLAGRPRLSHAGEHAFLGREETPLESTGTCPVWRRTHL